MTNTTVQGCWCRLPTTGCQSKRIRTCIHASIQLTTSPHILGSFATPLSLTSQNFWMSLYGSGLMHLFQEKDLGFFCKDCSNGSNALFSCDNRTTRAQPCYHLEGSPRPSMSSIPFLSLDRLVNTLEVCVGLTTDRYIVQNLKKNSVSLPFSTQYSCSAWWKNYRWWSSGQVYESHSFFTWEWKNKPTCIKISARTQSNGGVHICITAQFTWMPCYSALCLYLATVSCLTNNRMLPVLCAWTRAVSRRNCLVCLGNEDLCLYQI